MFPLIGSLFFRYQKSYDSNQSLPSWCLLPWCFICLLSVHQVCEYQWGCWILNWLHKALTTHLTVFAYTVEQGISFLYISCFCSSVKRTLVSRELVKTGLSPSEAQVAVQETSLTHTTRDQPPLWLSIVTEEMGCRGARGSLASTGPCRTGKWERKLGWSLCPCLCSLCSLW